ncbi:MAG: multidrug transporter AcrB [Burkholderiales bacterium RIFCSPHIGHO2_02_FULL_66_10]|jgi:multidrug efflux pump subunit AcrB|uniref:efflux RND transporter permease subunit n=1 Tax=Hydrogenophaga sp. TaxID=1904254 RepID=UPI0008D160A2|nr:efflux RND transporter permease subunit [Hydrogenophaga sp.]MBU4182563.1 efflux RND transporter permease subunit [Gammaproteobacteria bacterium]OGB16944.1 MAG: multidrug transporter AcrB [Burkholderiales bacterium RIFCSPHIGHO2_02_FULL_66_10]OGB28899.1 MAG: multidrug transporter AcrB [Burkholderiales bacterium RIFCSPLOWO2_02_FULL_66_35]MBU4279961.1 efflux RND transporter permease subunit [Gammaproteobacteria bacterium]MCG2657383.1 efflux RND transporter permease subunit [Hydrogenophaga sp.]
MSEHHPNTTDGARSWVSRFNLSQWALDHQAFTRYLMIVLMLLGVAAYFQLGQDEDPPFTFRAMVVRAYWPGATAQQMAEQVSDRIEKTLQEVPYADKIRSYSKPGESVVLFQVKDSSPPDEVPQIWYTTRKKIGDMRSTLPQGVVGPFFNDEFGDVFGVIYALQGKGFSPADLKQVADDVRQRLLRVKDVNKVELFGVQDEKLYVEISQKRLAVLGLDMPQVLAALGQQNAVESAGAVQAPGDAVQVRVGGAFNSSEQLRAMPIRAANGTQLRLGDIADIHLGYADPVQVKVRHNGEDSIALGISMAKGGDIIALGEALKGAVIDIEAHLPAGMKLVQVQDQPTAVARSVSEFVKVLIEAVVIVLAVSFLALGLHKRPGGRGLRRYVLDVRPGLVVFITIPLVLAITFLAMQYWGIGLHKISLGSLIIALGLLVDDAIIAVEMMVRKLEEGYTMMKAATFTWDATAMPMLTGTLITAAGFLPIGMANSTVGEYTYAIFAVTVIALVLSWIVAVMFVPYLGVRLLKVKPHVGPAHEVFDGPFYVRFRALVNWCVQHRWITIGLTIATFVLGMVGMGKVQQQFFPDSSRPEILMDVWLPEGSSITAMDEVSQRLENRLARESGVTSVTSWVGSGVPRFYLPIDQIFPQSNVSQLIVLPQDLATRETLRKKLPALLATEFPEVRGRVKLLANGPPVPYPVQFRVVGPDPAVLRGLADEVKAVMRQSPNTRGVNDNWNESVKVLRLEVDQAKARALGVSSQSIAQASRTNLTGSTVGQYRDGDKLIDIVLRQPLDERNSLSALGNGYLPTASGKNIPLLQIARPVPGWEPGVIWRENRDFAITVQSDVVEGLQGATVTAELQPALKQISDSWAGRGLAGYQVQVAGAVEESSKGSSSIAAGIPIMLFITFTLLMLQLQSFSRSLLVFLTGPLGLAGVAGALLLLNRPFGFVALLGVIALMGMIQRNSVILIDQIEQDRARGVPAWDAIVEAAVRRMRPIVLTAAAAVLAMIPLSRSVFWGPMAVAIMGGLIVATVLTLLALPAMYAAWFRVRR